MKPFAILTTIILGVASLSLVVWIGQYKAKGLVKPSAIEELKDDQDHGGLKLPKSGPYGKAEISETEFDFGTRMIGSHDEHLFNIKNSGEGNLIIKLGKPTCQCTVGEVRKAGETADSATPTEPGSEVNVAAGETISILVKWKMKSTNDKFRQLVPVYTTDPDQRRIDLAIKGMIDNPLSILPGSLFDVGEMLVTEPSIAHGLLFSSVFDHFDLTYEPTPNSLVKATWTPATPEDLARYTPPSESKDRESAVADFVAKVKSAYIVHLEAGPKIPQGILREIVQLKVLIKPEELAKTEGHKKPEEGKEEDEGATDDLFVYFTYQGRRSGPIELRGIDSGSKLSIASNRVILGTFPASKGKKAKITLFSKGMDEDLKINGIEPADSPATVKFLGSGKNLGKSKIYELEVEVPPGAAAKHTDNDAIQLVLKLNHPDVSDFRLLIDYTATN